PPAFARALGPHVIDLVLAGLATLAPIDVDRFFALHYTKLAAQSRASLDAWSERARSLGLPSAALDELRARTAEVARAA
ncbi:MAG TPA: hypothetical protein VL463_35215, partial [Kofleriaceae bacterium]|nr:hypothetical protein [Kofleriaceae bacterium]